MQSASHVRYRILALNFFLFFAIIHTIFFKLFLLWRDVKRRATFVKTWHSIQIKVYIRWSDLVRVVRIDQESTTCDLFLY